MEFHGKYSNEFHGTQWNSMEIHVLILHGIPWKIFHRIPWNSMEFHGGILHGLADLSIQSADPKRTRCFVNMQQMARQLSLAYMLSIDRIKFYSE